jgi:phytoene desaturase (3,4-didehydrolycopene-forming)
MTFSAMYMGMSPFDAPATYTLLQYAEYAKGVYYPIGGFQTLVAAFEKVAKGFGATFMYNNTVSRIVTDPKDASKVRGVETEDGRKIEADVVVSNADLIWTYNTLLPPSSYAERLQKKRQTCSSISFYWGLSEKVEEFGIHNIFLAKEYRESFDEIFEDGKVPGEPSFYVNVPSRIDPSAAPKGGDTLVVLVPCGAIATKNAPQGYQDKETFAAIKENVRNQILATIRARTGRDLAPLIRQEYVMDPWDWRERYGLWNGSILGLSHCVSQVLWFRPSNQHATLKNMFFVGASAMPGTGVPVVCAGSGIVADRIDAFLRAGDAQASIYASSNWLLLFAVLLVLVILLLVYIPT